jgi:hypothetical protein
VAGGVERVVGGVESNDFVEKIEKGCLHYYYYHYFGSDDE